MTSRKFSRIESLLTAQRPAGLATRSNLGSEGCSTLTCSAGSPAPSLGCVCSARPPWATSSLRAQLPSAPSRGCAVGARPAMCCFQIFSVWELRWRLEKEVILGSERRRRCGGRSSGLLNADEHGINRPYDVHASLVAKTKDAQTWEIAW